MLNDPIILSLIAIIAGYICGSIPFGLVLTYLAGYGDIRKIGSGNIGVTNVLRTGNKLLALASLILDSGKGAIPVLTLALALKAPQETIMLCALSAIIGHCYPVWLSFKGGKGFATTLGTLLAAFPIAGIAAGIAWLITAFTTRTSSLSALIAVTVVPIVTFLMTDQISTTIITALITALVFFRHMDNIKRILNGTEPKIGQKKDKAEGS